MPVVEWCQAVQLQLPLPITLQTAYIIDCSQV